MRDASREVIGRLSSLGVWLSGRESSEVLVQMLEAIERFEEAVRGKGGDLMVDEPPAGLAGQPDAPEFGLPRRRADERAADYVQRLEAATEAVRRSPMG